MTLNDITLDLINSWVSGVQSYLQCSREDAEDGVSIALEEISRGFSNDQEHDNLEKRVLKRATWRTIDLLRKRAKEILEEPEPLSWNDPEILVIRKDWLDKFYKKSKVKSPSHMTRYHGISRYRIKKLLEKGEEFEKGENG